MLKPISPNDVVLARVFPDEVIQAFNELITQNYSHGRAVLSQAAIVERLMELGIPRPAIFEKGFLDVEDVYRAEGWFVDYDKPGFNESYEPTFYFSRSPNA